MDTNKKKLSRPEAQMVADYLRRKGIELPSGWLAAYRLSPADVAKKFKVTELEIVQAARRPVEEKE